MKLTTYTPEFRGEAVKSVLAEGLSLEAAAQRLAIPKGTLANWVSAAKRNVDPAAAPGSRSVSEVEAFCEGPWVKFPRSTHPYYPDG